MQVDKQTATLKVCTEDFPNRVIRARSYSIRPTKIVTWAPVALIDATPEPLTSAISEIAGTGWGLEEVPRRSPERGCLAGYGIRRVHFRSSSIALSPTLPLNFIHHISLASNRNAFCSWLTQKSNTYKNITFGQLINNDGQFWSDQLMRQLRRNYFRGLILPPPSCDRLQDQAWHQNRCQGARTIQPINNLSWLRASRSFRSGRPSMLCLSRHCRSSGLHTA